jgi:DNA-binding FadR family transcriptional regulator
VPTADEQAATARAEMTHTEMALRRSEWQRQTGRSLAEQAADRVADLAAAAAPGTRLGTKEELRQMCGVSVGTFNEALRLLQTREVVTVRSGPGGGLFVAHRSPMVRLGNSVLTLDAGQAAVADAVRIRDVLDPLLIDDALWHASPADIALLRRHLEPMSEALARQDAAGFVRANWQLHAQIAEISPNQILRSLYGALLEFIESHTLSVLPSANKSLPGYMRERYRLHADLVTALEHRDAAEASRLIAAHSTLA